MLARFFLCPIFLILACFFSLSGCDGKKSPGYQIGIDPMWYPVDFGNLNNNVLGFSTEMLKTISRYEHIDFSVLYTNWDSLLQGLSAEKYEGALSSLHPYSFNLNVYDFSDSYLPLGPVLVVPTSSSYTSLSEIHKKPVAALAQSSSILLLDTYPDIFIYSSNSVPEVINQLQSGQVVGALLPFLTAKAYTQGSFQSQLKIVTAPLNDEGLRLITLKNKNPLLIKKFNKGLEKMKKDGNYDLLLTDWKLPVL